MYGRAVPGRLVIGQSEKLASKSLLIGDSKRFKTIHLNRFESIHRVHNLPDLPEQFPASVTRNSPGTLALDSVSDSTYNIGSLHGTAVKSFIVTLILFPIPQQCHNKQQPLFAND